MGPSCKKLEISMYRLTTIYFFIFLIVIGILGNSSESRADTTAAPSRWTGAISLGAGITGLKDDDPVHLMTDEFLGLFGGYRFNHWALGPVLDLRFMQQQSKLSSVGGTNFAGTGLTWGLGTRYDINPNFSIQAALLLGGEYRFNRKTYSSENANLSRPIGIEIKPQYFYSPGKPYSLDLDLRIVKWDNFNTTSGKISKTLTEMGVGLAFTFHFPTISHSPSTLMQQQPEQLEQTPQTLTINLAGNLFKTRSAELDDKEAREKLLSAAATLSKNPKSRVQIFGHTDSVGTEERNLLLSQRRAETIKAILVEGGVSPDAITAVGLGMSRPIFDNNTKEGRAKNRRVEIYVDEK